MLTEIWLHDLARNCILTDITFDYVKVLRDISDEVKLFFAVSLCVALHWNSVFILLVFFFKTGVIVNLRGFLSHPFTLQ